MYMLSQLILVRPVKHSGFYNTQVRNVSNGFPYCLYVLLYSLKSLSQYGFYIVAAPDGYLYDSIILHQ